MEIMHAVEHFMFSDPERRHETEITIQGLKQVFIFYSVLFCSLYLRLSRPEISSSLSMCLLKH